MATFFGEIVFSSSRAADDDDDEDDPTCEANNIEHICLELSSCINNEKNVDRLKLTGDVIVTVGPAANVFAECYVLLQETEEIGKLNITWSTGATVETSETSNSREVATLLWLKHHPHVLICQCKEDLKSHMLFSFVQQLFSLFDKSKITVTVLLTSSGSEFKTERSEINFPILRCLKTSAFTTQPVCPYLESPNTIGGLESAVLTHCQVHQIPAAMYVVYTDSIFMDVHAVNAFNPLLKCKLLEQIAKKTEKSDEMLQKSVSRPSHLDSLYI